MSLFYFRNFFLRALVGMIPRHTKEDRRVAQIKVKRFRLRDGRNFIGIFAYSFVRLIFFNALLFAWIDFDVRMQRTPRTNRRAWICSHPAMASLSISFSSALNSLPSAAPNRVTTVVSLSSQLSSEQHKRLTTLAASILIKEFVRLKVPREFFSSSDFQQ